MDGILTLLRHCARLLRQLRMPGISDYLELAFTMCNLS